MVVYDYGTPAAECVLIQPVNEYGLSSVDIEMRTIKTLTDKTFCMKAFMVEDWNGDLSPWEAPPAFGRDGFDGGAMKTLGQILERCKKTDRKYIIGGYSLAALFAIWAAHETDRFAGVAAASPSVWFPGFSEYLVKKDIKCPVLYLSLGDKEEKTRNPVMSSVGDCIRKAYKLEVSRKVNCTLEWNEGTHFQNTDIRTAKAFAWVLNNLV